MTRTTTNRPHPADPRPAPQHPTASSPGRRRWTIAFRRQDGSRKIATFDPGKGLLHAGPGPGSDRWPPVQFARIGTVRIAFA